MVLLNKLLGGSNETGRFPSGWSGNIYEVLEINSDTKQLFIKNTLESTGFWWEFFVNYDNIHIIRNSNDPNKTPIERKIAHLYKLFEERNK